MYIQNRENKEGQNVFMNTLTLTQDYNGTEVSG